MATPTPPPVDGFGFSKGLHAPFGYDPVKPSDLTTLKEAETMLIEKGKRIDGMDANQLARDGRDINEMKQRNATALADVRKEIQRLSK